MIFVTIGSVFPFDRMIRAMDAWAAAVDGEEVLAQIGQGSYEPRNMTWMRNLPRSQYSDTVARADLVIAHAGIGSLIVAGEYGKPIVVLPRRARYGEHNNDHQVDTAARLGAWRGVYVADTEAQLGRCIAQARCSSADVEALEKTAPAGFLDRIRLFATGEKTAP